MKYTDIVIGSGLWGCTVARRLADSGRSVLILERRNHIGGNCYCEYDSETGIEVHKYGCHIFHTSIQDVWNFICRFTKFNGYQHHNLSNHQGKNYFFPIGLSLINEFFKINLLPKDVEGFLNDEDNKKKIFEAFFKGYIKKQWDIPIDKLDPSIIRRIPIRNNYDINYYNDWNQGIPLDGYEKMFKNMIDDKNITIEYNREFHLEEIDNLHNYYYSGPIDKLFNYKFGILPWRSLEFKQETLNIQDFQGNSVVAYPDMDVPYTRIHEDKHFHPENEQTMKLNKTIITYEFSKNCCIQDEPYYPVNNSYSEGILKLYKDESSKYTNLVIGGRLGEFRYYDMDKTIDSALKVELL